MNAPTKAYSYLRFSTPEQRKGDSFARQTAMAAAYASRHGLELDQELTFHDLGVSAFRGQNAEAGKLADFLEAVRVGLVPQGSVLLVEQLDRISRLSARKALRVLEDIVEAGVAVVTLNDGRSYTVESLDADSNNLIIAILTFIRANEESTSKASRLKSSWENKRANVSKRPLTSISPAWVTLDRDTGQFVGLPERMDLVARMFQMTLDGVGQHRIAAVINAEGIKPWGSSVGWSRSYIAKILSNPAVTGRLTPHTTEYVGNRKARRPQVPIEDYFPAAVTMETYAAVQTLRDGTNMPSGRHASAPVMNILGSFALCPKCGGTVTRVSKGPRSQPSLVCAGAKVGSGCTYVSVRYDRLEAMILSGMGQRLSDVPAGGDSGPLEASIRNTEEALDGLSERIAVTVDNLASERSPALAKALRALEEEHEALQATRDDLLDKRAALSGPLIKRKVERLQEALRLRPIDRAAINLTLRSVFSRVVVNYPDGTVDFQWAQGGELSVPYALPHGLA